MCEWVNIRTCSLEQSEVKAWQISRDIEEEQGYTLDCEAMCDDPAGFQMSSDQPESDFSRSHHIKALLL